jgi:hypothetical protein
MNWVDLAAMVAVLNGTAGDPALTKVHQAAREALIAAVAGVDDEEEENG